MKKLLFFILMVFLFSCEKEKCETCEQVTTVNGIVTSTMTFEACGSDIELYDNQTVIIGVGVTQEITKTKCK